MVKDRAWWAVIPAAGVGSRFCSSVPKQYHTVAGLTLLDRVLKTLLEFEAITRVIVSLRENDTLWQDSIYANDPRVSTVLGGVTRLESVLNAVSYLRSYANSDDWICVHDAARPGLTQGLLERMRSDLSEHPVGGILGVPAVDTLKKVNSSGVILSTLDRADVWCAQTPQVFRYELLLKALIAVHEDNCAVTDEASAVEKLGYQSKMILGDVVNNKITTQSDLTLFENRLEKEGEICE